jgi:hypothetical protein
MKKGGGPKTGQRDLDSEVNSKASQHQSTSIWNIILLRSNTSHFVESPLAWVLLMFPCNFIQVTYFCRKYYWYNIAS